MLNVHNEYVNGNIAPKVSAEKVNPKISTDKVENMDNIVVNRDTFEMLFRRTYLYIRQN